METEKFCDERSGRADDEKFLRILNRKGGEPPRPGDETIWFFGLKRHEN